MLRDFYCCFSHRLGYSKRNYINQLELKTALNGLKYFAKGKRNFKVLIRVDNKTAIAYVNKMEGIRHPKLNNGIIKCEIRNIHIFASYISSRENKYADTESRTLSSETE